MCYSNCTVYCIRSLAFVHHFTALNNLEHKITQNNNTSLREGTVTTFATHCACDSRMESLAEVKNCLNEASLVRAQILFLIFTTVCLAGR